MDKSSNEARLGKQEDQQSRRGERKALKLWELNDMNWGVFLKITILDSNRRKNSEIKRTLFRFRCRAERSFVFV